MCKDSYLYLDNTAFSNIQSLQVVPMVQPTLTHTHKLTQGLVELEIRHGLSLKSTLVNSLWLEDKSPHSSGHVLHYSNNYYCSRKHCVCVCVSRVKAAGLAGRTLLRHPSCVYALKTVYVCMYRVMSECGLSTETKRKV